MFVVVVALFEMAELATVPVIRLVMLDQHRTDRIGRYRGSGGLRHDRPAKPDSDCNPRRDGFQHLQAPSSFSRLMRQHRVAATIPERSAKRVREVRPDMRRSRAR